MIKYNQINHALYNGLPTNEYIQTPKNARQEKTSPQLQLKRKKFNTYNLCIYDYDDDHDDNDN